MGRSPQPNLTIHKTSALFDLGVFFDLDVLLSGGFGHFLQVGVLDAMHQLDVLLQHEPFGKRPPGVGAVPGQQRTRG